MMAPEIEAYWNAFRKQSHLGGDQPFDVFSIGNTPQSADEGLALILSGEKTTTSCLPEEFTDGRPPRTGDLSVVLDGNGNPSAIVETISVVPTPFNKVDEAFAHAYGEWDQTLETWQTNNREYYKQLCRQLGLEWQDHRELLCETFRLVHPSNGR